MNFNQNVQIDFRLARRGILIRRWEENIPLDHQPWHLLEEGRPGQIPVGGGRVGTWAAGGKEAADTRKEEMKDKLYQLQLSLIQVLWVKGADYKYNK